MKKIRTIAVALFVIFALAACTTEVPVKEVKKCAKVVDVKIFKKYTFGIIPQLSRHPQDIWAYKILDNGKQVEIDPQNYHAWGVNSWLETAKTTEIGHNYCWTEYESIK